jgi:hypothetical protein
METYEPLKPSEIQRDAVGRFERKGTLAKAAKFKPDQPAKRRPGGTPFRPGVSGNPGGKPKGTLNRITVALKDAILAAGEAAGGEEGLTGYLTRLAVENSSAYAGLLAKILPQTLAASDSDGGKVQITFRRIIVHPGGREEIEGVTPKQLPAPDVANTLPSSTPADVEPSDIKELDD